MPVAAQTRLHVLTGTPGCTGGSECEPGRLLTIDVDRRAVVADHRARAVLGSSGRLGVTGDGEYIAWTGFEPPRPTVTVSATSVTTGANLGIFFSLRQSHVFLDRVAHRAFVSTPERHLLVVDIAGARRISVNCPVTSLIGFFDLTTMSGDRRRAFVRCPTSSLGETFVVDIASGS